MKKIIFTLSALALLAGCAKVGGEIADNSTVNLDLTVKASPLTKAEFNGVDAIKWNAADGLYLAIANEGTPTKAIMVASSDGDYASRYMTPFTIVDENAEVPEFRGIFYSIANTAFQDDEEFFLHLYGGYPRKAFATNYQDMTSFPVTLNATQSASQTSWDKTCDIMLIKPSKIFASKTTNTLTRHNEWNVSATEELKFAHLFGFGCLEFSDIPAEFQDGGVNSVTITATGENKNLVGSFTFDLTKEISNPAFNFTTQTGGDVLTVKSDGNTPIKDYKAYFVANPGTYDITVVVNTGTGTLTFQRNGLVITRSELTKPTIHFKEGTDISKDKSVSLEGDLFWEHNSLTGGSSMALSSSTYSAEWGTTGPDKMEFKLSYTGFASNVFPYFDSYKGQALTNTYAASAPGNSCQLLSSSAFKGVKNVRIKSFLSSDEITCTLSAYIVSKEGVETQLSEAKGGSTVDNTVKYFHYLVPEEAKDGQLKLVWDGYTGTKYCYLYAPEIALNAAPEITLSQTSITKVPVGGTGGTITCSTVFATGEPTVSVSDSWITASYSNNTIIYSVSENTDAKRTGTITVTVPGLNGSESTAQISIQQDAAGLTEYKVTIDAAVIKDALTAAAGEGATSSTLVAFNMDLTAVATDGSGKTAVVPTSFKNIYFDVNYISCCGNPSSEIIATLPGVLTGANAVSEEKRFGSGINATGSTNNSKWSGTLSTSATYTTASDNKISSSFTVSEDLGYKYARIKFGWTSHITVHSFEIKFVM